MEDNCRRLTNSFFSVGANTHHGLVAAEISALVFSDVINMKSGGVRKKITNANRNT